MTHHTLIAMFGTGAAYSPPCGLDYLSESRRERLKHIPGLGEVFILLMRSENIASEFIFREMTALLLF